MPRIVAYVNESIDKKIQTIQENSQESLSKIIADLIESGIKIREIKEQENQKIKNQLNKKNALPLEDQNEHLLQILYIVLDIYRCVRNEKSKYETPNIDEAFKHIASLINKHLDNINRDN